MTCRRPADVIGAVVVVAIVIFVILRLRELRREAREDRAAPAERPAGYRAPRN